MFGVVPRVLWERVCPPDELNRIKLTCNCLFIDTGKEKILDRDRHGRKMVGERNCRSTASTAKSHSPNRSSRSPAADVEDITIVINTHLHFDHAGGNTVVSTTCERQVVQLKEHSSLNSQTPDISFQKANSTPPKARTNATVQATCPKTGSR